MVMGLIRRRTLNEVKDDLKDSIIRESLELKEKADELKKTCSDLTEALNVFKQVIQGFESAEQYVIFIEAGCPRLHMAIHDAAYRKAVHDGIVSSERDLVFRYDSILFDKEEKEDGVHYDRKKVPSKEIWVPIAISFSQPFCGDLRMTRGDSAMVVFKVFVDNRLWMPIIFPRGDVYFYLPKETVGFSGSNDLPFPFRLHLYKTELIGETVIPYG